MTKIVLTTSDELQELIRLTVRQELNGQLAPTSSDKEFLSIDEASEFLNLPKATLYQFTSQRKIPFIKSGKRLCFARKELVEWQISHRKQTRQEIENEAFNYNKKR